jgi:hypothetical protein
MYQNIPILATLVLMVITNAVMAQDDFYKKPQMAINGDFLTNAAPVQGKVISGSLMAGGLWRIITSNLNCRQDLSLTSPIVRTFKKGDIIQADVGGGGADEVLYNPKDRYDNTWMLSRSKNGRDYKCYVRANKKYIEPVRK